MTDEPDLDALMDGVAAGAALLETVDAPWLYQGCSLMSPRGADTRMVTINPHGPQTSHALLYDRANERAWVQSAAQVSLDDHR